MDSGDEENLALIKRPDLGCTFTKLHCWRLTQYARAVFLDADCLLLHNSDELFTLDELSAAPDFGWPDCFNSGVFVFQPSLETYRALVSHATSSGSFDGGDQGLLNQFFSGWRSGPSSRRLSIIYNMSSAAVYTYAAAYRNRKIEPCRYGDTVKIVHFLGSVKPWNYVIGPGGVPGHPTASHQPAHVAAWWALYLNNVRPPLQQNANLPAQGSSPSYSSHQPSALVRAPEASHKEAAEAGFLDIAGRDSFDNILAMINKNIAP